MPIVPVAIMLDDRRAPYDNMAVSTTMVIVGPRRRRGYAFNQGSESRPHKKRSE